MILSIDPGCVLSAFVLWDGERIRQHGKLDNETLLKFLRDDQPADVLVIEQIASYGMAVGETTFETVFWSGRFAEAFDGWVERIKRLEVKLHLCHDSRAKDANIRQAIIDRLGPQGTKKAPGPTYGLAGDEWAALAVALTWWDKYRRLAV